MSYPEVSMYGPYKSTGAHEDGTTFTFYTCNFQWMLDDGSEWGFALLLSDGYSDEDLELVLDMGSRRARQEMERLGHVKEDDGDSA